jgi:hypothetical protein
MMLPSSILEVLAMPGDEKRTRKVMWLGGRARSMCRAVHASSLLFRPSATTFTIEIWNWSLCGSCELFSTRI